MATEEKQGKRHRMAAANRADHDGEAVTVEDRAIPAAAPAAAADKGQKRKSRPRNGRGNGHTAAEATPADGDGVTIPSDNGHSASAWSSPNPLFEARFRPLSELITKIGPGLARIADSDTISRQAATLFGETLGIPIAMWRLQPITTRRNRALTKRQDLRQLSLTASYNLDPGYRQSITAFAADEARATIKAEDVTSVRQQAVATSPTVAAWVHHEPIVVSDITQAPRSGNAQLDRAIEQLVAAGVRTVYSIPLLSGKRIIGVVDLYYQEVHKFLPGEEAWLQMAVTQVANSFEYADFQEEAERKTAEALLLRDVSQMINRSLDLDETLAAILASVHRLVPYDGADITLLDPSGTRIVVRSIAGAVGRKERLGESGKVGEGYTGWVARERKPLLVNNVADSAIKPNQTEVEPGLHLRSYIGLPIIQGDNLLGALELISLKPNAFTDDDLRLLGSIAEQAATAIENAELHRQTNQRNRELALLQDVSASLNASLDLKETLRTILLNVGRIINYKLGEVTLFDSLHNVLVSQFITGMGTAAEFQEEYPLDEFSYSGWLGRNLKPLLINNAEERDRHGIVSNSFVRSYLGVPMMISGRLIGTIEISADVDNAYTSDDLNILTLVANQAAIAVENARLYEQTDERLTRRLQELTILQRIGQEMNSTLDVNQIFNMVIGEAVKATGALMGAILEVDSAAGAMNVRAVAGDRSDSNMALLEQPFLLGSGLMGRALKGGESLLLGNVTVDPDYIPISPRTKSELVVPIRYEEVVVGLIDLNGAAVDGFDLEHLHFIESLASQTATAIGVAQSYAEQVRQGQQLARRANQLSQVLEIGSSLTPDRPIEDVLDQVANAIADTLNYRIIMISLVEGEGDDRQMHPVAGTGVPLHIFNEYSALHIPIADTEVVMQERFRISRSYFVPAELSHDLPPLTSVTLMDPHEARAPNEWQADDLLLAPMYSTDGDLLGKISVDDPTDRQRPNRNTIEALEVFANQAAGAVENARLINSYRQRIFELDALSNIGREVTANLDVAAMCEAVYAELQRIMQADAFNVALSVDDTLVSLLAVDKGERYHLPTIPLKGSLSEQVIKQGQALLINRQVDENGEVLATTQGLRIASGDAPRSWLGVPLRIGENVIGVLTVQHYGSEPYGEREEQLLTTVANQLAPAIQNARLFERNQERVGELAMLNEVGSSISAIREEQSLYEQAYSSAIKLLGARSFSIALRGDSANLNVVFHRSSDSETSLTGAAPLEGSLAGVVINTRRPLLIGNLSDPDQWPLHASTTMIEGGAEGGSRSWLGVPLLVGDQALGALVVQDAQAQAFNSEQATLFTLFANQFSTALANADLFERNQRRINELAALTELGRELTASHDIKEISRIAQTRLQRLIPFDVFLLGFYEERTADELHIPYLFNESQESYDISAELGNGPGAWVINNRQPLLLSDVLDPRQAPEGADELTIIEGEGLIHSWMGAPLLAGERAVGLVSVQCDGRNVYTNEHLQLLTTVANQLAVALQNAQSFARNQQRISELALINEAAREITANLDVDQICELLYQQSQRLFNNDLLLLGLYDAGQQMINPIYYRERANEAGRELIAGFPFGQGLSSRVIAERRPLLIKNLEDTTETGLERGTNLIGSHMEQLTKSWLGVPLLRGDEVIGVLNIQSYKVDAFSEEQIPLLGTLASQTVVALQNAQLFQRNELRINELAALSDLGRKLTSQLDVAQIGRTIYESIKDSFPLDAYFMLLYDERHDTGFCPIYVDDGEVGHDERPTPLANSLSSYVIQQRKPLLIADLNDPTILPEGKQPQAAGKGIPIRSWLGVPMIIGNRVLGVVGVQSYNVGAYSNNEAQFLSTVASQASVAIENAYLFEQYKQRINELNSLNELTRSVTASMHVDAVAISVHDHIKKFVDLDVFMLALYDEEHNLVSWPFVAEGGERITDLSPQQLGLGISSLVIESQQPLIVQDLLDADSLPEGANPIHGGARRVRSWAGAPMMVGRQVIGVISVQAYEPGQYDQESIRPLLSVANQAAIAIQNTKLFEERERKIAELATINQMAKEISSSLQLDELLQLIYNQITQVMSTRNFLITLYDERRQEIQYRFMREHGRPVTRPPRKPGSGLVSQIIESRQPLLINYDTARYAAERGWEHSGEPARSWLGVPMTSGDQILGVIVVQSYDTEGAYNVDDLSLLSTIASQAAVAIEKAKLFEETQSRVLQLDTLNEIGRILGAVLDEETVFQKIFEHTSRFFDELSGFYIGLYQREQGMITFPFAVEDEQHIEMAASPLGEGLTSYVIANRRALLIDDLEVMAREYEGYHTAIAGKAGGERSWMGVPLFLGGEVIGLISLQSRKPNAYRQEDLQFLATLASQAAVAIKNAKLFDEIREFNATLNRTVAERTEALGRANQELRTEKERISQLYEINHQLTTSLDLDDILNRGLQLVASAVGVERGSIMTIDPTTNGLVYRAVLGNGESNRIGLQAPWQSGQGASGWAVANRVPLLIADTNTDQRWVQDEDSGRGVGSIISVPLMSGSDVFGVLNLVSQQPNFFNESHLRLVSTVANEIAVFVHNAELYSYISEQSETLASSLIVQEQEASRSRAIVESIADGVLVFDSENRITLINPAAEAILGVSSEMLMNRYVPYGLRNLELGPELLDLVQSVVNAAHEGARGALTLSRRRFSMNGRVISVSLSPVTTSKREMLGLVAVLRDITREVEIEREKSDFVSTVSHELRTPMTVIKGHTDLLLAGAVGALSPMQGNFLQAVKRNTDRMNTLVSDLLTVSRIETGRMAISMQPNYYEAGELVDGVVQTLRSLAEAKNQQLILDVAAELPEVLVDRDRTIQVLTNLLSNSIKYTPNNGRIEVNVACNAGGAEVLVEVTDNGIGIAEKDQEKLFQPFYRSDNAEAKMQEGTGLGLVIAKSLVELQGGRLWLKSKLGEGTSFSFTMPAYKEQLETTSVQLGEDGQHGKARILVVDNDAQVANELVAALEHEGYATLVAYSGRKAIEIASAQRLDLITMDIVMPEMDGFETMKALGDDPNSAGVPILIVSQVAESEQGFALGAVGYVSKPANHDVLIRSVEQALAARPVRNEIKKVLPAEGEDKLNG